MAMMGNLPAAVSPDAYVEALSGWQRRFVEMLRAALNDGGDFEETIKWTNLLFSAGGPCVVIRAEEARVILAFFRGKRVVHLDPRLKPSGKYELANLVFTEKSEIDLALVSRLAGAAVALNLEYGDPTARR